MAYADKADILRGRRVRDSQLPMHSASITTACCEFESRSWRGIQHYVIKFVSGLRQVCDFLRVIWFPPSMKLPGTI